MQLIWTPKLINICGEDTRELFRLARPPQRSMQRPFLLISMAWPFCYLPQVNNKAAKGLCIICTQRWKQTCCFACHFPTFHLPLATCHRVELSWAQVEFPYKIYLFRRHDLLPKGVANEKNKRKEVEKVKRKGQQDLSQAGNEVQGIVSSFGNEVTFKV